MVERPVFKSAFRVEVVEPEGVFLLSERGHFVLKGELHCRLAPLLDGGHTADEIVVQLMNSDSPADVYYALAMMEKKGYIVEASGEIPLERAAFWHALGADARAAEQRLRGTTVSLVGLGMATEPLAAALNALHIQTGAGGDFSIVLTDNYLQEGLAEINAAALAAGRAWLLVQAVGTVLWIGPIFQPGKTGCWECLAQRLRGNREVESYLQGRQSRQGTQNVLTIARGSLPASVESAMQLAALETAKWIAGVQQPMAGVQQSNEAVLTTIDTATLECQKHILIRRPQCPACGDGSYAPDRTPAPVVLQIAPKGFTADGGHRSVVPEQTVARYQRHVSPITGAVTSLVRLPLAGEHVMHVYSAGHNLAMQRDSLYFLRQGLRSKSAGKGMTDAQAQASGLCEALERYSGNFQGNEIRRRASYRRLGADAVHPNACMLFSDRQFREREAWNASGSKFSIVPMPLDEEAELEWTPVWSLTERRFKYLPTGYLYYGYPIPRDKFFYWADSNGNAAGNSLEEAIVQGFMELVERDAVCLWWYNRVQRPSVDLESFDEPYIGEMRRHYASLHRDLWMLDLTTDLGIPAFAAISRRTDKPVEDIMLGLGAHFDPKIAALRALTELNQFLPALLNVRTDGSGGYEYDDQDCLSWWKTATLANQPYLAPNGDPPHKRSIFPQQWSDDSLEDVLRCQAIVEQRGLEMLVLDQTRPDIGLPVAKVLVPGLRHFWARFGPGRLYDVPVQMGWLPAPLTEEQLNPIAMFI